MCGYCCQCGPNTIFYYNRPSPVCVEDKTSIFIWNILFMAPRIKLIVVFSLTLERFEWNEYDVSICWLQILVTHWLSVTWPRSFRRYLGTTKCRKTRSAPVQGQQNVFHIGLIFWPGPVSVSAMNLLKIQLRDGVIAHSFNAFFFLFCAGQLLRRVIAHEVVSKQGVVNHLAIKITRWLLLILELIY